MTSFPEVAYGPIEVVVRFRAEAAEAVRAKTWHPSQRIRVEEGGEVVWRAWVQDWRPLIPWILSWGAACQVESPAELLTAIRDEARALAQAYGWFVSRLPAASGVWQDAFWEE